MYICQHQRFKEDFEKAGKQCKKQHKTTHVFDALKDVGVKATQNVYVVFSSESKTSDLERGGGPKAIWFTADNEEELIETAKTQLTNMVIKIEDDKDEEGLKKQIKDAKLKAVKIAKKINGKPDVREVPLSQVGLSSENGKCFEVTKSKCSCAADIKDIVDKHKEDDYNAWSHNGVHFACAALGKCTDVSPIKCLMWSLGDVTGNTILAPKDSAVGLKKVRKVESVMSDLELHLDVGLLTDLRQLQQQLQALEE